MINENCSKCSKPRVNNRFGQCKGCKAAAQAKWMDKLRNGGTPVVDKSKKEKDLVDNLMAQMAHAAKSL